MFGFHELRRMESKDLRRATLPAALAFAAAASFFAVSGSAQAQDCLGGYKMLKGEIPVLCQAGPIQSASGAVRPGSQAMLNAGSVDRSGEPLATGLISRTEQPANAARPSNSPAAEAMSNGNAQCVNGMR